ncbi:protein of unknown function [Cohaesibacter sp. ES.047]|uniref:DUF883 family protein n=1 Tax=Cohaesibacter sp. ES.047 TaxID=1798205 RepID=UPI000BB92B5E|nr:DUF883 C-terminal domain-containing protein [Cohaesibacter sp. ES.047]SNY91314.1 protein of unknown function [Cohaesibacter sp. ES.047]
MAVANKSTQTTKTDSTSDAAINEQIDQLRKDIAGISQILAKRGSEDVIRFQDRAKASALTAADKATEALTDANKELGRAEAKVMLEIRKKPLAAIGIAAGVGLLVGLMSRK